MEGCPAQLICSETEDIHLPFCDGATCRWITDNKHLFLATDDNRIHSFEYSVPTEKSDPESSGHQLLRAYYSMDSDQVASALDFSNLTSSSELTVEYPSGDQHQEQNSDDETLQKDVTGVSIDE
jgi:hypothetical protein